MKYQQFTPDPRSLAVRIAGAEAAEAAVVTPSAPHGAAASPAGGVPPSPAELPNTLDGLIAMRDSAFVDAAYRVILGREPDPVGADHHLAGLRAGTVDKIDVLGGLRYSAEGQQRGVPLPGLRKRYALRRMGRLPVVGPVFRWLLTLLRLPLLIEVTQRHQAEMELAQIAAEAHASAIQQLQTETAARALSPRLEQVEIRVRQLSDLAASLERTLREARGEAAILSARVERHAANLETTETTFQARHQRLTDANARLMQQLRAVSAKLAALQPSAPPSPPAPAGPHSTIPEGFDTFYLEFEDRFRGSAEDTKGSHEMYLDYVAAAGAGAPSAPVLDVGCGRGEWLDLLREHGCVARGVDVNSAMVIENTQRGLDVVERDVLAYLADLPADSVRMVTGFHIIEHLPFAVLVRLFDECRRVLQPGGCVLFETPNPENLVVGAYTFYFDPTHRNPLPPQLVEFLAQHRGFAEVEIQRLHPRPEEGLDRALLDKWFRAPTDYAVIGWKGGKVAR